MSGVEVPAFLIGVAGLFGSCVDAFAYFKLAQRADREVEVVLLKLDIEKTRLLIWGDQVGMFSASHQDHRLLDKRVVGLIQRILSQIESLLTDSEKLRASYGVRNPDSSLDKAVDYVSSKSLAVFRTSASRFWTRNASKLATKTTGKLLRTKWAIYEREKFQSLINDLSDFIDNLFELFKVAREVQDRVIIEDIESILDIAHLDIIEEATEDSYRRYSQAAASVRALTEAGTVDRRTVEEHLRDVEDATWSNHSTGRQSFQKEDSGIGLRSILEWVQQWESHARYSNYNALVNHLDIVWLDRRLDCLDYEQPYDCKETADGSKRVLILGEADYLTSLMQKAPGRIARATEIWTFDHRGPTRTYSGRFFEHSFGNQSPPQARIQLATSKIEVEMSAARKSSDPLSSGGKRRRLETGWVANGGGEGEDKDEDDDQDQDQDQSKNDKDDEDDGGEEDEDEDMGNQSHDSKS
ncbi:hypothetical protein LTR84_010330 [Exophiala bonariae]|uniref:Prion-inhibition and propagation HeLo domain-containing protein n=1 Tax=Exophiala bonariae TaxID=1690606 RepID=A0AAV9MTM9_9EURO|nr:hypothetical protein LTR84_010330 [Exophiala bonariae]